MAKQMAQRVYSTDASGNRREYSPMFHFWWVDPQTIRDYDYLFLPLPDGSEIARAGGEFFRSGSYVSGTATAPTKLRGVR